MSVRSIVLARLTWAWPLLLLAAALLPARPAHAWVLRNFTGQTVTAYVNNQTYSIAPHDSVSCDYRLDGCTGIADDAAAQTNQVTLQMETETFNCVLPLAGGGTALFQEWSRAPLNVPYQFSCASLGASSEFIAEVPYGVHATQRDVRFLVTGDPQYDATDTFTCDPRQVQGCDPGDRMDANATLGAMANMIRSDFRIRGAIVAGDLVHNGQRREFQSYKDAISGMSRFFYDGFGNHDLHARDFWCDFTTDGTCRDPVVILDDIARRKHSTRLTNQGGSFSTQTASAQNFHYSWDWHDVHFVQLNLFPGDEPGTFEGYDPKSSLTFLQNDLRAAVGSSQRPVVLIHHYGFDCFSRSAYQSADSAAECYARPPSQPGDEWWSEAQRAAYWNAIKDYNVTAIFTGHQHLTGEDGVESWSVPFRMPRGAAPRPDGRTSLPSFIAGAARGATGDDFVHHAGVFLDVAMDECSMLVKRKLAGGQDLAGQKLLLSPSLSSAGTTCGALELNDDSAALSYSGSWTQHQARPASFGDRHDDVHATLVDGDSVSLTFEGTRVSYIAERSEGYGGVLIQLDGQLVDFVDLDAPGVHNQGGIVAFTSAPMAAGTHTLKLTKQSGVYMLVDGFTIER